MSEKKNLPAKVPNEISTALQNSGTGSRSILDMATQNLTNEELSTIRAKALEEKLRIEVEAQQRSIDYQFGRKTAEDHIDTFNMLEKSGGLTSQKVVSDIKTGAGNMRIESKSGTTCFVATAAYGDPDHQDVVFLRKYRDEVLTSHAFGRAFIAAYWRAGPLLSIPVARIPLLRKFSRQLIASIVDFLKASVG
jgi:hypothetical protein